MIPKFKRPVFAFTLSVLAIASWFAAGALLSLRYLEQDGLSIEPVRLVFPAIIFSAGVLFLGLGQLVRYAAEAAHYAKYVCWEMRIANQLTDKKKPERHAPIIPTPEELVTLEPIERVFRHFGQR